MCWREDLLYSLGRAAPWVFSTRKNCQAKRNQLVINTENCEKKILKQVRHLKTSKMNEGNLSRRKTPAGLLGERFESNIHMIQKSVEQDEKNFTLEVPVSLQNDRVYGKGKKSDIPNESLFSFTNKMCKKSHGIHCIFMVWCNQTLFNSILWIHQALFYYRARKKLKEIALKNILYISGNRTFNL